MKTCTTIALVSFAVVAALVATSMATNSTWGQRGYYDRLLFSTQVVRASEFMRKFSVDVEYPAKYAYNPYTISQVVAIDHKRKDGGYAQLRKGGPGYRNVTLHIKSERNHGLNYTIQIYGN
ncbi:PREDICTED: probable salivary secreted peptide [Rhagoletis zephyria]|uniref:probable salivary secreted peptide n=1 Tax=Rhagoletis zephyria TaxID=28612 RepID=UPI0008119ED2|nr:PREDICTED: probable salivary secreted peptide [Rhagoletis zephyria]XP_036331427.1 probable salivary secreted peptide [Rhagoletis pomonella]